MFLLVIIIAAFILISFVSKSGSKVKNHTNSHYPPTYSPGDNGNFSSMDGGSGGNDCGPSFDGSGSDGGGCGGGD